MNFHRKVLITPAFIAAMLLGATAVSMPISAAHAADAASTAAAIKNGAKPVDDAERRIKELHAKLHITAAQDPQWEAFTAAQRDSAEQMSALIVEREKNTKTMSAKEDFHSYQKIAEMHVDGLKKIIPAFDALYDSMTDDQKKTADALFRHLPGKASS